MRHISQYSSHFVGLQIQPRRSNPIPSIANGALGPALVLNWRIFGFLTWREPIPNDLKADSISHWGRTSLTPVNEPVIVDDFTSDQEGEQARKKASTVTNSLNFRRVNLGKLPWLIPWRVSTHSAFTLSGKILGSPCQGPFRLCRPTQVERSYSVLLWGSTKQITNLNTSDQYLIVKVIPLFDHISVILGTTPYNKRHCPFGTRNLLSKSSDTNLTYLQTSPFVSHWTKGSSPGRRSTLTQAAERKRNCINNTVKRVKNGKPCPEIIVNIV